MPTAGFLMSKFFLFIVAISISLVLGTAVAVTYFRFGEPLLRRVKIRVAPVVGVGTGLMIARFFQMGILGGTIRKSAGLVVLNAGKAAVFVGVGHWLHDTPPVFRADNAAFLDLFRG